MSMRMPLLQQITSECSNVSSDHVPLPSSTSRPSSHPATRSYHSRATSPNSLTCCPSSSRPPRSLPAEHRAPRTYAGRTRPEKLRASSPSPTLPTHLIDPSRSAMNSYEVADRIARAAPADRPRERARLNTNSSVPPPSARSDQWQPVSPSCRRTRTGCTSGSSWSTLPCLSTGVVLFLFGASSVPQTSASVIPTSPPAPQPASHASSVTWLPAETGAHPSIPWWRRQAADPSSDDAGNGSGSGSTSATGGTDTASITSASNTTPSSGPSSHGSTAPSAPPSSVDSATSQTTTAPPPSGPSDSTSATTTRGSPSPQSDSGSSSVCPPSLCSITSCGPLISGFCFAFTGDDDWVLRYGEPAAEPVSPHVVLTANLASAPHNVLHAVVLALALTALHIHVHVLVFVANRPDHGSDITIIHQ
ncbi:hypothetical protein FKP32DRAFT_1294504 [Trametes sanguinea]|nr:hypothetical protein FKP32DRAFT_1294504 [Trametes sanguinea]